MKNHFASESQKTMSETYLSNKRIKDVSDISNNGECISKNQRSKSEDDIKRVINEWEENIDKDELMNSIDHIIELEDRKCDFLSIKSFNKQKLINSYMRSKLFDWMMLVCTHKEFTRDTFHLSVRICDIAFCRMRDINSSQLQLIAVTSLFIATKFEEDPISPHVLSDITENYVSKEEILKFELELLNVIGWKLRHSTLSIWANYISYQWDLWVNIKIQEGNEALIKFPIFWEDDSKLEKGSQLISTLFKCVDLALHDINYYEWESSKLISALLYIVVGTQTGTITYDLLAKNNYDIDFSQFYQLNDIIDSFLSEVVDSSISELNFYLKVATIIYTIVREDSIFKIISNVSYLIIEKRKKFLEMDRHTSIVSKNARSM